MSPKDLDLLQKMTQTTNILYTFQG
ncbi:UNVERIFIED_CONTAM: hypothetical protein GTU68_040455 [Idotea baltica]|nr:hypothetical protein [Idotea baltica]